MTEHRNQLLESFKLSLNTRLDMHYIGIRIIEYILYSKRASNPIKETRYFKYFIVVLNTAHWIKDIHNDLANKLFKDVKY